MIFNETLEEQILGFKASDAQLLDMIAADNDESDSAFQVLISRHRRAIQAAIRSAGARGEDAEDAFSEVCLKLTMEFQEHRLQRIVEKDTPVKYLYGLARNATIDYLRKNRREDPYYPIPTPPRDPSDPLIEAEMIAAMRKKIQRLGDVYVEVFDLMIPEYNRREIAEILSIKLGTVDSRIAKIRKALQHHRQTETDD